MDNSCVLRSRLIKQFHIVVWMVLLIAGTLLGSRVFTDQGAATTADLSGQINEQDAASATAEPPQRIAAEPDGPADATASEGSAAVDEPTQKMPLRIPTRVAAGRDPAADTPITDDEPDDEAVVVVGPAVDEPTNNAASVGVTEPTDDTGDTELVTQPTEPQTTEPVSTKTLAVATIVEPEPTINPVDAVNSQEVESPTENETSPLITATTTTGSPAPTVKTPPRKLSIENPQQIGYPVAFLYGKEPVRLAPGEIFSRTFDGDSAAELIQFDRGGNFGEEKLQLDEGEFVFTVTRKGWKIVARQKPATPANR